MLEIFLIGLVAGLILIALRSKGPQAPQWCQCDHPVDLHDHYRDGTDCALCTCAAFRAKR